MSIFSMTSFIVFLLYNNVIILPLSCHSLVDVFLFQDWYTITKISIFYLFNAAEALITK